MWTKHDSDDVRWSNKSVITIIDVLGSDDHIKNSCNHNKLSDENKLCLEILSVASLSVEDFADNIYTKVFESHEI